MERLSEWYETGALKEVKYYIAGLLHGDRSHCALTRYYPERTIAELQDFRMGQAVGDHIKYSPQGKGYTASPTKMVRKPELKRRIE